MKRVNLILLILIIFASCDQNNNQKEKKQRSDTQKNLDQYVEVKLVSDINVLSESEKQVLPLLVEVADIMDKIFWYEAIGNRDTLCNQFLDSTNRKLFDIN